MSHTGIASVGSRKNTDPPAAQRAVPSRYISVGIEGTLEPVSRRHTLDVTGHFRGRRWSDDFGLVAQLGVAEVRYPIPWHAIETTPGQYRWRRLDRVLGDAVETFGLSIIADPLHHTSYPHWLEGGFLNPRFAAAYVNFVAAFAERYPQISALTPFNEPTCTLDFCGNRGFWHPYAKGESAYVTMLRHTARAAAEATHAFRRRRRDSYVLHVDTFERHTALDRSSEKRAHFLNERRFLFEELITGRVDTAHPLWRYLVRHGFTAAELCWHQENPVRLDERGGNYYPLKEEELRGGRTHAAPSRHPVGFSALVREYAARLSYPLSLTETNIQGIARDRISWLKYILQETERLQADGITLRRFAWYPLFDCAGWNSLLQGKRWRRDPQGIYSCDRNWNRVPNEFSGIYRSVALGNTSRSIPSYTFTSVHEYTLGAIRAKFMNWDWIDQAAT